MSTTQLWDESGCPACEVRQQVVNLAEVWSLVLLYRLPVSSYGYPITLFPPPVFDMGMWRLIRAVLAYAFPGRYSRTVVPSPSALG